ncbi:LysR family substrate-binding domain-containing protein [Microbacterium sp. P5_E9]
MAKSGGSRGARGRPLRPGRPAASKGSAKRPGKPGKPGSGGKPAKPAARKPAEAPASDTPVVVGPLALGVIPGATPGKWIDAWQERMPGVELSLHPISVAEQDAALRDGGLDAALVRLPIDAEGLHVIPLYDERPVVVAAADSHLMAADELDYADLAGEIVVVPRDDVLHLAVPDAIAPSFAPPEDTELAIATVAAGIGVVIVPMSLARLHHRKDVDFRPLCDGPVSTVALAWPADRTTPAVQAFVGIVRGRTPNSSR